MTDGDVSVLQEAVMKALESKHQDERQVDFTTIFRFPERAKLKRRKIPSLCQVSVKQKLPFERSPFKVLSTGNAPPPPP